ncbi:N-glycosylase/DNA lyase [Thermovibrio sp.]
MEKLAKLLSSLTSEDVALVEESDRQFKALKRLYESLKDKELFFKLVVVNSLLSYQLQMKGEEYWEKFADFFSKGRGIDGFKEFLSLYNRRFLGAKLKRLEKVKGCTEELFRKYSLSQLGENLELLVNFLSRCLGQSKSAKTVVFAAKMFTYGYKIAFGKYPKGLEKIDIPLDSRLKKLFPDLSSWRELSKRVGIPPLLLDAVIWVPMGGVSKLPDRLKELRELLSELV